MTEDITSLKIRILYDDVKEAEARLNRLERTGKKTQSGMGKLGGASGALMGRLAGLAAATLSVTAAINGMRAVINKTAEFQKLRAGLVTATGSLEGANVAFEALQDYASSTPSQLTDVVSAFTKLVNYGLTPSERALRAYGDTSSALGKDLEQMVEAVADAVTGEFERLKEFGIKASKEGDQVSFTFRGVTTTVKNSAQEIEEYLISLGENNFAGAMGREMETLGGQLSNLGDEWDKLLANIGENGFGDVAGAGIQYVIDLLAELNAMIASGELQANLDSWAIGWQEFGGAVGESFDEIVSMFRSSSEEVGSENAGLIDYLIDHFQRLPLKWKAGGEIIGNVMFGLVEIAKIVATGIYNNYVARFEQLVSAAVETGRAIANALANPIDTALDPAGALGNVIGAGAASVIESNEKIKASNKRAAEDIQIIWDVAAGGVKTALEDYDAGVARIEAKQKEAQARREAYDKEREARMKAGGDRLAGFGITPPTSPTSPTGGGGGGGGGRGGSSEFERLVAELGREEEAISDSYNERLRIIEENTRAGSQLRADLELAATEAFEEESLQRLEILKREPETMFAAFEEAENLLRESYERRREIILSSTETTEEEKLALLAEAEARYTAEMRRNEVERVQAVTAIAGDFFSDIATLAKGAGKKGAKIAKAAAIAQTTIKTYEAATSAYAAMAGIPYVGPALGAVAAAAAVAAGMANIQRIKSQDDSGGYAGAYATGGMIPPGSFGLVGEAGPELVRGPAMVTSAQSTADRFRGGGSVNVVINNNAPGVEVETRESQGIDGQTLEVILRKASERTRGELRANYIKGGNPDAAALEKPFNLKRGTR